jgi:hypothetical protein
MTEDYQAIDVQIFKGLHSSLLQISTGMLQVDKRMNYIT